MVVARKAGVGDELVQTHPASIKPTVFETTRHLSRGKGILVLLSPGFHELRVALSERRGLQRVRDDVSYLGIKN